MVAEFGLSAAILADFRRVFARYPDITQVLIFGSRAKGTCKDGSDIDLAVLALGMGAESFTRLWDELDALPLVFKLDLLHWDTLDNLRLKEKISAEGKLFYDSTLTMTTAIHLTHEVAS